MCISVHAVSVLHQCACCQCVHAVSVWCCQCVHQCACGQCVASVCMLSVCACCQCVHQCACDQRVASVCMLSVCDAVSECMRSVCVLRTPVTHACACRPAASCAAHGVPTSLSPCVSCCRHPGVRACPAAAVRPGTGGEAPAGCEPAPPTPPPPPHSLGGSGHGCHY